MSSPKLWLYQLLLLKSEVQGQWGDFSHSLTTVAWLRAPASQTSSYAWSWWSLCALLKHSCLSGLGPLISEDAGITSLIVKLTGIELTSTRDIGSDIVVTDVVVTHLLPF